MASSRDRRPIDVLGGRKYRVARLPWSVMQAQRTFTVVPRVPESLHALVRLTSDVAWIHEPEVRALMRTVDPDLLDVDGLDPIGVLARAPQARLDTLAADPMFVAQADGVLAGLEARRSRPRWFDQRPPSPLRSIAYVSAEFGLAASVPQYSGGLGVLAGDHLKSAAALGVPITAVGLFYRHGYFRQQLDRGARQVERFPRLVPEMMAMQRVDDLHVEIPMGATSVRAAVWQVTVDTVPLYLLDSEVADNEAPDQLVTDRLYGGGSEQRIRQEMLLGVGGLRTLRALGTAPDVFHLNEGHAGFLALELIREAMHDRGLGYDDAVEFVRPSIVFTTHTPVPAGIDRFPRALIEHYLGWWCAATGRSLDDLMALGSEPGGDPDTFNLAAMSLRLAGWAGGVSELHGGVSRELFQSLWPQVSVHEVPITSVTNGVHGRTWVGDEMAALLHDTVGPDWAEAGAERWAAVRELDDHVVWQARSAARSRLVGFARRRIRTAVARRRGESAAASWTDSVLDPEALTIGFARRFATYKRATLLLRDLDRLRALVTDPHRPVQLLFTGKAHPADEPGKEFLRAVAALADDPELRSRIVFLEDYDIDAGRALTQGCDVWLNTPLRPMEACGTSGMKSAYNGGLNCSVLDGWWDEWYTPERGWAIPSADWIDDPEARDDAESDWLFDLIEREIVPLFFHRDPDGLPSAWLARVKGSLAGLGPLVSADRMVAEYVERAYAPAAARTAAITADDAQRARALAAWRRRALDAWPTVAIESVDADDTEHTRGEALSVEAWVRTGALGPDDLRVEIVHGPVGIDGELQVVGAVTMHTDASANGTCRYQGSVPCDRLGSYGFAVRVVADHPDLHHWLDLGLVHWADAVG